MLLDIRDMTLEIAHEGNTRTLCRNLNFTIHRGETLGILGESGSGKSITALSILRLLPPTVHISGGVIDFTRTDGSNLNLAKASVRELQSVRGKEISMVFQEPMSSLNPVFTCGDQVLETILRHRLQPAGYSGCFSGSDKAAKEQVLELFNKVKLPDPKRIFDSYPHQLSGGQKQRVMIAIAISCNPDLLIADEPTTALDVTVQMSILELLKELQAETGMAIVLITHDISVIAEIARRVLVFYRGEIVEQGNVSEILDNPKHVYTQGLLGCRSSIYKKGTPLKTLDDFMAPGTVSSLTKVERFGTAVNNSIITSTTGPSLPNENVKRTSILSIQNMFVNFGKKPVLQKINMEVFDGETLGLVGESGSGKTTLGRTIMKLIEKESGSIHFHGKQIDSLSGKELKAFRKKVQIIFQDPYSSLNPKMTIGEIIEEPLIVHKIVGRAGERKVRVLELLKQVNLGEEHYGRYPHQFSGGQRQRIGIARALAVEPELLILDESVSALDVSIQAQILNLLNNLKRTYQLTYIFISHDLNIVRYMADRMIVLKDGIIVEEGLSDEVFNAPQNPYTAKLIASIPG
jgi:peptide/nickel transport system ATP-binding protein